MTAPHFCSQALTFHGNINRCMRILYTATSYTSERLANSFPIVSRTGRCLRVLLQVLVFTFTCSAAENEAGLGHLAIMRTAPTALGPSSPMERRRSVGHLFMAPAASGAVTDETCSMRRGCHHGEQHMLPQCVSFTRRQAAPRVLVHSAACGAIAITDDVLPERNHIDPVQRFSSSNYKHNHTQAQHTYHAR